MAPVELPPPFVGKATAGEFTPGRTVALSNASPHLLPQQEEKDRAACS